VKNWPLKIIHRKICDRLSLGMKRGEGGREMVRK